MKAPGPDLILFGGKITTCDRRVSEASAVAIQDGRFRAVGSDHDVMALSGPGTSKIDLTGRRVVPGLNDSHTHVIRGGLTYNSELRWDGCRSLAEALEMLREQAARTPAPQWVRVIGGWSEFQFAEKRMPTLAEINEAAPDTPVFVLHLYARALLNRAALRALGYDDAPPAFDRGIVQRDERGRVTGMLVAKPSALVLYATLAKAPKLAEADQVNGTRQFMRELNRLGVTSAIDAGGGGQSFPDDYRIIRRVHEERLSTVRIAYNLFAQQAGSEYADYERWVDMTRPGDGDAMLKMIGAGENLVWTAADFENFLEPRPTLVDDMESSLRRIVTLLATRRWPWRIHATYEESIRRFLDVFEEVNRTVPLDGLHWIIDHAETISDRSIERIARLGGGIAVQHRMAFQGEYFIERYGRDAVKRTPPLRRMLELGAPVGMGTDATRVASYNPWVAMYWLTTGRTIGGTPMYGDDNLLEREEALRLWTTGSAWFSSDEHDKGKIAPGMLADLAVLSRDFLSVPDDEIQSIESDLTVVDGRVVFAQGVFETHDPGAPPPSPDWAPPKHYGGYQAQGVANVRARSAIERIVDHAHALFERSAPHGPTGFFGNGCDCFAI